MLVIKDALLPEGNFAHVVIEGRKIHSVRTGRQDVPLVATTIIDAKGLELYPALIDPHVHDRYDEPEKEDVDHLETACIEGGVGTICTMPNGKSQPFKHIDMLEQLRQRWQGRKITVRHHIGMSRDNLMHIGTLDKGRYPALCGGKTYNASSTNPNMLIDDTPVQRRAAEAQARAGLIALQHAEAEDWIKSSRSQIRRELSIADHCLVRPSGVEIEGIRRALSINKDVGGRMHFCHVSTPRSVELILEAKSRGQKVTLETCPHYWLMNSGHLRTMAGYAKMNPALRSEQEMSGMERYLCLGLIDVVATDHAPHRREEKERPDYDQCPSGVPGVQTMGLLIYDLKQQGKISAQQFADLTSRNAAKIFGFETKGKIKPGFDADLVLINPNSDHLISNESMKYKCGWTPFNGQRLGANIEYVILGGEVVKQPNNQQ